MNLRPLGATGIQSSIVGLGTGRLGSASGGISGAATRRLLDAAADCGVNLIDTADSYGQGECEKLIGAALSGQRSRFIVVSKAGYRFSRLGGLRVAKPFAKRVLRWFRSGKNFAGNIRANVSSQNFSADYIEQCVHGSLQRLQTDYLDVFLLHSPPPQVVAEGHLLETLRRLKLEGKIRHFGLSAPESGAMRNALQIPDLAVIETPVNPGVVGFDLSEFEKSNKGVLANQIFLSGKLLENNSQAFPGNPGNLKHTLRSLAVKRGISLSQLLIQYALSRSGVSCVLTGTHNPEHLRQNVADALAPAVLSGEDFSLIGKMNTSVPKHD